MDDGFKTRRLERYFESWFNLKLMRAVCLATGRCLFFRAGPLRLPLADQPQLTLRLVGLIPGCGNAISCAKGFVCAKFLAVAYPEFLNKIRTGFNRFRCRGRVTRMAGRRDLPVLCRASADSPRKFFSSRQLTMPASEGRGYARFFFRFGTHHRFTSPSPHAHHGPVLRTRAVRFSQHEKS